MLELKKILAFFQIYKTAYFTQLPLIFFKRLFLLIKTIKCENEAY